MQSVPRDVGNNVIYKNAHPNLSPTHFVSDIRHQHRCSHIKTSWYISEIHLSRRGFRLENQRNLLRFSYLDNAIFKPSKMELLLNCKLRWKKPKSKFPVALTLHRISVRLNFRQASYWWTLFFFWSFDRST